MNRNKQIKIALVDDHNLFRKGLIKLIDAINDRRYFILFEAVNGKDMISQIDRKALPDIIIMDIDMDGMGGFESVHWLQQYYPQINILVVSMIDNEDAIVRMLKLGVKGYLSKDIEVEDLAEALSAIASKGFYYTDFITGKLIHSLRSPRNEEERETSGLEIIGSLTEQEREFVGHACSEMTYEEIAQKMFKSVKTVENYRDSIYKKFDIKSRSGLVLFAVKHKIIKT